jgi:hypothetical protein
MVRAIVKLDELLLWLKEQGHTGAVTIHFAQGTPNRVEIPKEPQRIVLDSSRPHRRVLTATVESRG